MSDTTDKVITPDFHGLIQIELDGIGRKLTAILGAAFQGVLFERRHGDVMREQAEAFRKYDQMQNETPCNVSESAKKLGQMQREATDKMAESLKKLGTMMGK